MLVLALVLRTARWWPSHNFLGVLEYDDGVYYAAAKLLLHGHLPYSGFTIVHPPGLCVLLLPAAGVGQLLGDPWGMAAGRLEMQLFVVANLLLIRQLAGLLPLRSPRVPLVAMLLYAVMPNAVSAAHTILLEPMVTCLCLLGTWFLLSREQPLPAGICFAAGVSLKLFAGAYVVAALGFLLWRRQFRALPWLVGGGALGSLVFLAPFFVADPGATWHDVVVTQLNRPRNHTVPHGLDRLLSMVGLGYATVPLGLLLLGVLVVATVLMLRASRSPYAGFWVVILVLMGVAFATSPTYFAHYGEFLGPAVALLASQLHVQERPLRLALGAFVVAFGIGTAVDVSHLSGQASLSAVAREHIPAGSCVFYDAVSLALAADVYRDPSDACPSYVDGRGIALTQNPHWPDRVDFYPAGFVADQTWQAENRAQMAAADFLLLRHDPAVFPEWNAQTRAYATGHFAPVVDHLGGRTEFHLWRRVSP